LGSVQGTAYDNWTNGGPYLWAFNGAAGAPAQQAIHQIHIPSRTQTGFSHDVGADFPGVANEAAGGLFTTEGIVPGTASIGGVLQGTPNMLFVYELVTFLPEPPILRSPGNGAANQLIPVTLDWDASPGATSYQAQVSTDSSFTQIIEDTSGLMSDSYVVNGLANNKQYWWRVSATNMGGTSNWSTVWSFTTIVAAPPAPALVSPADGATNQPIPVTLDWDASPGATSYQVQVATDVSFTQIIEDTSGLTGDSYTLNGLANSTQYWWRVSATNIGGTSNWSTVWSFTTIIAAPPPPALVSPPNGATNQQAPVTLDWDVSPGATSYQVQIATDALFTQIIEDTSGLTGDSYAVSGLASNTQYWWRVSATNTGGTSNWSTVWSFSTGVFLDVPMPDTTNAGLSTEVLLVLPPGTQTVAESLFYRRAGEISYASTSMTRNADSIIGVVPGEFVTLRGVEFYLKVTIAGGQEVFVYSVSDPGIIRVRIGTIASPLSYARTSYKMISVPLNLDSAGLTSVLNDDFGQYDRRLWRVYRWEVGSYHEYDEIDSSFSPGTSFWLISHEGKGFDVDGGLSVNSDTPLGITLQTGWNQIANPFAFRTMWDTTNLPAISLPVRFNGIEYELPTSVLEPWEGYFVENTGTVPLTVLVQPREVPLGRMQGAPKEASDYELRFSTRLEGSEQADSYNYIGVLHNATMGFDSRDYPEPPPIEDRLRLSIVDGDRRFMRNTKSPTEEGHYWDMRLTSPEAGQVSVEMSHDGNLPDGFSVFVLDQDRFRVIPVEEDFFVIAIEQPSEVHNIRVILGTADFAEKNSGGIPLIPLEYQLEQNFPNPFNPQTTIRYQLSERTDVSLEIFNIVGQRVRTLVREEQVTGSYSVIWAGQNDAGNKVGSGVYFYRLLTTDFVQTKKLVLLR